MRLKYFVAKHQNYPALNHLRTEACQLIYRGYNFRIVLAIMDAHCFKKFPSAPSFFKTGTSSTISSGSSNSADVRESNSDVSQNTLQVVRAPKKKVEGNVFGHLLVEDKDRVIRRFKKALLLRDRLLDSDASRKIRSRKITSLHPSLMVRSRFSRTETTC